jgi:hypothetical protein
MISDDKNGKTDFPIQFLNQQCLPGIPLHLKKLKVGAFIIFLRDLDPKNFNTEEITTYSTKGECVFIY